MEYYEKRNLELASKWPNGIPEGVQKEIYDHRHKNQRIKMDIIR